MTQKIKSIKIIKDFPNLNLDIGKKFEGEILRNRTDPEGKFMSWEVEKYPEFFEIEYEPEKLLKRPDGSLITSPKNGTKCVYIQMDYKINEMAYYKEGYTGSTIAELALRQGHLFLAEDLGLANKKAAMKEKRDEIRNEIDRLNAEQGWVWQPGEQYSYIDCNGHNGAIEIEYSSSPWIEGRYKMSPETADTILQKYTTYQLKQFLGIII